MRVVDHQASLLDQVQSLEDGPTKQSAEQRLVCISVGYGQAIMLLSFVRACSVLFGCL